MVWMRAVLERRNPSVSASSMATSETSGRSSPSRSRLTPINTSNSLFLKLSSISDLSKVLMSMQIGGADFPVFKVFRQIFGDFFGQGRNQDLFFIFNPIGYFAKQILNFVPGWPDDYLRINNSGRSD